MILQSEDGQLAKTPEQGEALKNAGYQKCYNPKCGFFISPEAQQKVTNGDGYYTCPERRCYQSHSLMEDMPWHGVDDEHFDSSPFSAGGGTRIGISMQEQAQIGEDLIQHLGELPGYGPIVWWHPGGSVSASPLDGTTHEWGIEVKTIGFDAIHHRFVPGRPKEREDKNQEAQKLGLKGVLGILVMLNYRTSMADIYAKEMPLVPWQSSSGGTYSGVSSFRTNTGQKLLESVPFKNPLMDSTNSAPHMPGAEAKDLPF